MPKTTDEDKEKATQDTVAIDTLIDDCVLRHFHNAPGISDNTMIFNQIRVFVDDLKTALKKEVQNAI